MNASKQTTDILTQHDSTNNIRNIQNLIWVVLILAGIYGLHRAISLAWVGDDAFISFRYAKNLIEGNGLVFNIGERVEGYTNFLWTIMIAGALFLRFEPILFTQIVGIASYITTIVIVLVVSIKLTVKMNGRPVVIPAAAATLMVHYDFQIYATSGLETAWVTALVTLAFAILVFADSRKSCFWAGLVMLLAVLSRPDSLIFYIMGLPYIYLQSRHPKYKIIFYLVPLIAVYLPYWLLRFSYYGYPFPNTYYAKSAYLSWYSQGFIFLMTYFKTYYIFFLLPLAIVATFPRLTVKFLTDKVYSQSIDRVWLLGMFFIVPYLFYVVRIGGDFMHARFFIVVTPIGFLILETVLLSMSKKLILRIALAAIIVLSVFFRWDQFAEENTAISGIIDERTFYPAEKIEQAKIDGGRLKEFLNGLDVVIGFYGAEAMLMYYAEIPTAIECHTGLTDEYVAHLPLEKRGRIGHEKEAPPEYMVQRRINFVAVKTDSTTPDQVGIISFAGRIMPIKIYDNSVMTALRKFPEVEFVDFQEFLDKYISQIGNIPTDRLYVDFRRFKRYYFDYNDDPERMNVFIEILDARMNSLKEAGNR